MEKKTFIIDIDDTLIFTKKNKCDKCDRVTYEKDCRVDQEEIDLIHNLYEKGHIIILWTGRNWDCYEYTVEQLKHYNIMYHQLIMGKPQGHFVDKDCHKSLKDFKEIF